jgi:hypothetical protein
VILRGAGLHELQSHLIVLWTMAFVFLAFSTMRFHKRLA